MECCSNLGQEDLEILAAEVLLRNISDLLEGLATRHTRLGIVSRKRQIVVPGFEISPLLLRQLESKPGNDGCSKV